MKSDDVYDSEMRNPRNIDDAHIEAALAGHVDAPTGISEFVHQLRSSFADTAGPMPDNAWEAIEALSPRQPTIVFTRHGYRRSLVRVTTFLSALVAKLGTMGFGAKAALAAVVATTAVGGAAAVSTAPTGPVDAIVVVTTTTLLDEELTDDSVAMPEVDSSSSTDTSIDDDGSMDAAADGDNTLEGAPQPVVDLVAQHCGITSTDIPDGVEFDWSWDSSVEADGLDESVDFDCEWVDAAGCEIEVSFSSDRSEDEGSSDSDEGVSIENSCDDDDDESSDDDLSDDDDESSDDAVSDDDDASSDDDAASSVDEAVEDDHASDDDDSAEHDDEPSDDHDSADEGDND